MIKIKAGYIDVAKLEEMSEEVSAAFNDAFQKRMNDELIRAMSVPAAVLKPSIKIEPDPRWQVERTDWAIDTRSRYVQAYATAINNAILYTMPTHQALPTHTHTTTRKDGREQATCTCGCCAYPHRAGSIKGCQS